jgi:predicted lipid-binding transport protein (Tim44 family)
MRSRGAYTPTAPGATAALTQRPRRPILNDSPNGQPPKVQTLELVIFAVLAAVVIYQLYAVLGKRVGRQPEDGLAVPPAPPIAAPDTAPAQDEAVELQGLAAIRARDGAFEVDRFLAGARTAYETIVRAFADGDREALKPLVSAHVMAGFEAAMAQREAEGRSESAEFSQAPRADIESAEVEGDSARIRTRFLAEFRSRFKGPEGEAVDDRRTAEVWTFERDLNSRDPNWTLVRVEAAEA